MSRRLLPGPGWAFGLLLLIGLLAPAPVAAGGEAHILYDDITETLHPIPSARPVDPEPEPDTGSGDTGSGDTGSGDTGGGDTGGGDTGSGDDGPGNSGKGNSGRGNSGKGGKK